MEFLLKINGFCYISKKFGDKIFKINFLHEKKLFSVQFFFRSISWISAFQRTQARLQGVQTTRTAGKTLSDPPKSANGYGFYKTVFIWTRLLNLYPEGGSTNLKACGTMLRRPLELKSSGNGSIGIDLTSKKDFMKKYLFFFENESIKVENSENFCDFLKIFEIPLGILRFPL